MSLQLLIQVSQEISGCLHYKLTQRYLKSYYYYTGPHSQLVPQLLPKQGQQPTSLDPMFILPKAIGDPLAAQRYWWQPPCCPRLLVATPLLPKAIGGNPLAAQGYWWQPPCCPRLLVATPLLPKAIGGNPLAAQGYWWNMLFRLIDYWWKSY